MFPSVCTDTALADKSIFKTLIRLSAPYNKLAKAMRLMFRQYSWSRFSIFSRDSGLCSYGTQGMFDLFHGTNVTLTDWIRAPRTIDDEEIERALRVMRNRARGVSVQANTEPKKKWKEKDSDLNRFQIMIPKRVY